MTARTGTSLQQRGPVEEDVDPPVLLFDARLHQEALAVRGDRVVVASPQPRPGLIGGNKYCRHPDIGSRSPLPDIHSHQLPVRGQVEELLSIATPLGLTAAVGMLLALVASVATLPALLYVVSGFRAPKSGD